MNSDTGRLISETEARRKAEETLAFEIGNLPRLGEVEVAESEYIYPLEIRLPRVIFDQDRDKPVDVKFMNAETIGEITVDAASGEVSRPHLHEIESEIRRQKKEVENVVHKALVRSSAKKFSQLPFPEHRYTPILDVLSHLIIEGPITAQELSEMSSVDEQKYRDYVDILAEVDLVRWESDQVEADNILIEILAQPKSPPEHLNAAMAHFFKQGAEHIGTIREILGPHLLLSGHYYYSALGQPEMPRMGEREFDDVMKWNYSGNNRNQKRFKLPRYLIQLEDVGLLESENGTGPRAWKGKEDVQRNLLRQDDLLAPISEVIA
ncbi:hypothetical protein GS429_15885 [Natronorubrum sp. JWXQ-INN-674]|uniref:Uncharacterized protein n=1 Tax=Natronorubrum halalkaliphilum TaxID=2691917 RepID=A0A6B0VSM6_9EURY|nr:hypothetical protein [Natronorubrum halalkaliphilum]MXV63509.1 hypothetical protein [Natronorubrum halalkaliphilum]